MADNFQIEHAIAALKHALIFLSGNNFQIEPAIAALIKHALIFLSGNAANRNKFIENIELFGVQISLVSSKLPHHSFTLRSTLSSASLQII
jgi:hypothetical protein